MPRIERPQKASERQEWVRWRAAFTRDAVAGRLAALAPLLERQVRELEMAVADARVQRSGTPPSPPPVTAKVEPPTAAPRPEPPAATESPPAVPTAAEPTSAAPAPVLAGSIEEGLLADVLQMLSSNLKTGLFQIRGPSGEVNIWFDSGEVSHATVGTQTGEAAFFAGLASPSGSFSFVETTDLPAERTITAKTQFLILEGFRMMDEEGQGHGGE